MDEVLIRGYNQADRNSLRDIACNSAFMGKPCEEFFEGRDVFADFLTLYFTDYEPQSCFVAEVDKKIVGYIIGAKNSNHIAKTFLFKILPGLLKKIILQKTLLKKKNLKFLISLTLSFLKGELKMEDFSKCYPATLHINIADGFRNSGIGSKLMSRFFDYLAENNIPGVYLGTLSQKAAIFFQKQGFSLLHKGERSYFRHILGKDVPFFCYGKRLRPEGPD